MISPEEFIARWSDTKLADLDQQQDNIWGVSPLVRYDPQVVERLPLPPASQRFLIEAGLPEWTFHGWRFSYPSNSLPPITEAFDSLLYPSSYARYRVLGADVMEAERNTFTEVFILSAICLDVEGSGQVVKIMTDENWPVKLLNSSVMQLAEFILLYRQYIEWRLLHQRKLGPGVDYENWEEEEGVYFDNMAAQMLKLDPAAGQPGTATHREFALLFSNDS
jgi:hypothetical protein